MSRPDQIQQYHVAWFIDANGIHDDVTVEIADGKLQRILRGMTPGAVRLENIAMIPGLVNAHTHLEFSQIPEPIPASGRFTDWIRAVVDYRRSHPTVTPQAVQSGILESLRAGTTLIGDIATNGWAVNDYAASGFQGVIFQELLGLNEPRVTSQCELANQIASTSHADSNFIQFGLSPHAPYSVHPLLFQSSVGIASSETRPIAIHLAETEAELELLAEGTGEFREMLTEFGIWREGLFGGQTPMDYLSALAGCSRVLIVHGNYLNDQELQFIAKHRSMTLIYCPRTHAAFRHQPHPWRRLLELGGSVAIGTDSRASNPDLSLFAELQFLASCEPEVSHLELLRLGTEAGRTALLCDAGNDIRADFCLVRWNPSISPDPARNLFAPGNQIVGTMVSGTWWENGTQ